MSRTASALSAAVALAAAVAVHISATGVAALNPQPEPPGLHAHSVLLSQSKASDLMCPGVVARRLAHLPCKPPVT